MQTWWSFAKRNKWLEEETRTHVLPLCSTLTTFGANFFLLFEDNKGYQTFTRITELTLIDDQPLKRKNTNPSSSVWDCDTNQKSQMHSNKSRKFRIPSVKHESVIVTHAWNACSASLNNEFSYTFNLWKLSFGSF